ncbi:hypothetical protein DLJ53_12015 [Acuticoccus sediminis]|uniref:2-methylcitrate dehydratase PrpD n=1 Tax=Acuticoccus sediminis TaxID=2184697 RepID=A0A8B2NXK2_9HYPH|nr:MmgE/PrpD family protein [Acuticoccus sediminis]RAI02092.1 hypothetical protein DLJ53_12015 [Acuticoccus sediminis]
MTTTRRIAEWAATAPRTWSADALRTAHRAFVDTLGVTLAGQAEEVSTRLLAATAAWGDGAIAILGRSATRPAPWAALVNGAAAHALDFDDVLDPAMAHPSAPLVPALLALGEETGATWGDVLDAYIVGFEVMARLGEAMNLSHYHRGWHTTLSLGSPACAVAAARLLGLDVERTHAAFSAATSMAGGSKQQFGAMMKPVHSGLAAKNGLVAARFAEAGITAAGEIVDGPWGMVAMMAEGAAGSAAMGPLGAPPAIEEHGVWAKRYPSCASTHRPADALLALKAEGLTAGNVESIVALVSPAAQANLRYRIPEDPSQARFSLGYCAAAALIDGDLTLASFAPAAIARADVRALAERVGMDIHPDLAGSRPVADVTERTTVIVTTRGGATLRKDVGDPRGHPRRPLTDAELTEKFLTCAAAGGIAHPQAALEAIESAGPATPVRDILGALTPRSPAVAAQRAG